MEIRNSKAQGRAARSGRASLRLPRTMSHKCRPLEYVLGFWLLVIISVVLLSVCVAAPVPQALAEQVALNFAHQVLGSARVVETWRYDDLNGQPAVYLVGLSCPKGGSYTIMTAADDELPPVLEYRTGLPVNSRCAAQIRAATAGALGTDDARYVRGIYYTPEDLWLEYSDGRRSVYVSPFNFRVLSEAEVFCTPPLKPNPEHRAAILSEWQKWLSPANCGHVTSVARHWISGVPDYDWHFGCGPTAATNVLAYWDRRGYSRLVDSVWYNRYDPVERDYDSVPNCDLELALAMGTDTTDGRSRVDSLAPGIMAVCNSPDWGNGYSFTCRTSRDDHELLVGEVNRDRPGVLGLIGHPYYGNHTVTFVGWGPPNDSWICIHDEWSTGSAPDTVVRYYYGGTCYTTAVCPGGFDGPDAGVVSITCPTGVVRPESLSPRARVCNNSSSMKRFRSFCRISPGYADSQDVGDLAAHETTEICFATWRPPNLGVYEVTCSTYLPVDSMPLNNVRRQKIMVDSVLPLPWTAMPEVPAGSKRKAVAEGGSLASDGTNLYAWKGNGTTDLYAYSVAANAWTMLDTIPKKNAAGRKKGIRKGAALACAPPAGNRAPAERCRLYALKGNGTLDFWVHDATDGGWRQLADVPAGTGKKRDGTGLASVMIGDTEFIYLLKCSKTCEFYRYNTIRGSWATMAPAPLGTSGKTFQDGSCTTADGGHAIYALKGHTNEFFSYDVASNVWTTLQSLPEVGLSRRKLCAASGAALAADSRHPASGSATEFSDVYALKGGNTLECWRYRPLTDQWTQQGDLPGNSGRRVRSGGSLIFVGSRLFALKGNGTREFYLTIPAPDLGDDQSQEGQIAESHDDQVCGERPFDRSSTRLLSMSVTPNPCRTTTRVKFTLTRSGPVSLGLYDITGKLVSTLGSGYHQSGTYALNLSIPAFPVRGISFLRLETPEGEQTARIVIAR